MNTRTIANIAGAALLALTLSSCLYDEPCSAHQEPGPYPLRSCVCEPGYVLSPKGYGCVTCGSNQEVVSEKCVCKSGYARSSDTAPCEKIHGSAAGDSCDADHPCGDPNPFCAQNEDAPYCTTEGCNINNDCPPNWRCAADGDAMYCRKPPSGYLKSCQTNADCTDSEAPYCEIFMSHTCIVNDCLQAPAKCLSQSVCCDLTSLIGEALCVPTSTLTDGKCFTGAAPVTQ